MRVQPLHVAVVAALTCLLGTLGVVGWLVVQGSAGVAEPLPITSRMGGELAQPAPTGLPAAQAAPAGREIVDPAWVQRTARAAGIPWPAVRAYGAASLRLSREDPSCRLGWTTLAGIGWVESHHGTTGGRTLGADGRSSAPILGPALDGGPSRAAIRATEESSRWHGDTAWDHAVGPLQFIPSTWSRWQADGDGDGTADPNDVDDAAYAAARYLCADGRDLTTGPGWNAAVFSYNHSRDYVYAVSNAAVAYGSRTR